MVGKPWSNIGPDESYSFEFTRERGGDPVPYISSSGGSPNYLSTSTLGSLVQVMIMLVAWRSPFFSAALHPRLISHGLSSQRWNDRVGVRIFFLVTREDKKTDSAVCGWAHSREWIGLICEQSRLAVVKWFKRQRFESRFRRSLWW